MQAAGAKNTSTARTRKNIPRTFNRHPKPWLQPILDLPKPTGERLFKLRHEVLGLSRADTARLLRIARNTLWDWETGVRQPPFSAYLALRLLAEMGRSLGSFDPWKRSRLMTRAENALASNVIPFESRAIALAEPSLAELLPRIALESRAGYRGRVRQLQERMSVFSSIYNGAWLVRDSWYGPAMRRQECVWRFVNVLARELQDCHDYEALIYAVADALTCSPHGVPWEA
jgi:transcriptional regulator with XRE-family HTH domain